MADKVNSYLEYLPLTECLFQPLYPYFCNNIKIPSPRTNTTNMRDPTIVQNVPAKYWSDTEDADVVVDVGCVFLQTNGS